MQRHWKTYICTGCSIAAIATAAHDIYGHHGGWALSGWHISTILLGAALLFARDFDK